MAEDTQRELEQFRSRWREEVTARSKGAASIHQENSKRPQLPARRGSSTSKLTAPPRAFVRTEEEHEEESSQNVGREGYHDFEDKNDARRLEEDTTGIHPSIHKTKEPRSALEHYERAVEKEDQGNLGDSLSHYRKAYRLDAGVDKIYKNKHFPPSSFTSEIANPNPSNAAVTVPNPAHHSLDGPPKSNLSQLIASLSTSTIQGVLPVLDRLPPPPCPIASIPSEILIEILQHTAIIDIASYARLSQVCKQLAYLIATEDNIWRRICLGVEYGFPAMHYTYACTIEGTPEPPEIDETLDDLNNLRLNSTAEPPPFPHEFPPLLLFPLSQIYPTYAHMFHIRPRLRFNGCYISKVNYIRPGASTPSQVSWNTPVHIVTYYRYLRFFRDGTCVSLLTTIVPVDVVYYLTREYMHNRRGIVSALSSVVMKNALRGRWKLSPPSTNTDPPSKTNNHVEPEGNLSIETEGVDPKYTYSMQLALRSSSKSAGAAKNNKLVWRGFWSYNRLTDDWAEFGLRNDRAFFWSRVESYGMGD